MERSEIGYIAERQSGIKNVTNHVQKLKRISIYVIKLFHPPVMYYIHTS